ncbi:Uncharacterised protein [Acinetobacter baumannii]|nr:Uncharacterised protein [Acinetobacter baumannii]
MPAIDDRLTIRPQRCACISGSSAWQQRNTPRALTFITRSQSARLSSATLRMLITPALFTATSSRPNSVATRSTIARTLSPSLTSTPRARLRRPRLRIAAAVSSATCGSRSATATSAPARARARAMPRPMPRPAPVTSATREDREKSSDDVACMLHL